MEYADTGRLLEHQGKKSTVAEVTVEGNVCILKKYNSRGEPTEKKMKEVGFCRYYEGCAGIPRLISAEPDDSIIIEKLRGRPLKGTSYEPVDDVEFIDKISFDYGGYVGGLASLGVSDEKKISISQEFFGGRNSAQQINIAIENAKRLLSEFPEYDNRILRRSIYAIEELRSIDISVSDNVLCKLDWNPGNIIVDGTEISGLIDFEQSFWGTTEIFWGTVLDHINLLNWSMVMAGAKIQVKEFPSKEQLRNGAFFSMWYKMVSGHGGDSLDYFQMARVRNPGFAPEKVTEKFLKMERMALES